MAIAEVQIQSLGPKGDGIYQAYKGTWGFIDGTAPGDLVRANLYRDKNGIFRGKVIKIIKESNYRQNPPCPHFENCGNCTLQHLQNHYYRQWKIELVRDAFQKQRLRPLRWLEPTFIDGENRRRVTFTAVKRGNSMSVGYHARRSQEIAEIDSCSITQPRIFELKNLLHSHLASLLLPETPIDIFVQSVRSAVEVIFTGSLAHTQIPKVPGVTRIGWRKKHSSKVQAMHTAPLITNFGPLRVNLPYGAFLQPTLEGEKFISDAILSTLPSKGIFADLFSGCGTFSGPMLQKGSVDAYELSQESVKSLSKAASHYPLRAYRRDLFRNPLREKELNRYDAIVFDPPREGCEEQARNLSYSKVPLLVGVSCNPATFARDARILCDGGYWLQSIQILDQFYWSHHVETIGIFTRKKYPHA